MGKITDQQRGFFQLLNRSPDKGDGWRQVSTLLWDMTEKFADALPELVELDRPQLRVRLSDKGRVVMEYLI